MLETVRLVREQLRLNVNLSIRNISFSLPDRPLIDQTFLAMAVPAGITCAIVDSAQLCGVIRAAELLLARDEFAMRYISYHRSKPQ